MIELEAFQIIQESKGRTLIRCLAQSTPSNTHSQEIKLDCLLRLLGIGHHICCSGLGRVELLGGTIFENTRNKRFKDFYMEPKKQS